MSAQSILVVDDEPKVLEAIDRELFFWKNEKAVRVLTAVSAKDALDVLATDHDSIQVIVSDLKMADMSGDQLIQEAHRLYPSIRSILITGYSELNAISRAVSAGITGFIPKPWDTDRFIAELENAMGQYRAETMSRDYHGRLVAQLERTGQIQKRLFEHELAPGTHYGIEVTYRPLEEFSCGGDFYQVIPLDEDRAVLIVGDVSGHGLEAAFVTGIVRTLISRQELAGSAGPGFSPAAFLGRLNAMILRELARAPEFIIAVTAVLIDCAVRRLVFSNAGSLPLYAVRRDGCDVHSVPGFPCGFSPDAEYTDRTLDLRKGDKVVLKPPSPKPGA